MMPIPVSIEQLNGHFVATVLAMPSMRVEADTEHDALAAIRNRIRDDVEQKKVVLVEMDLVGLSGMFGKNKSHEDLQEICDEAYRLRDEQKRAEFPDDGV